MLRLNILLSHYFPSPYLLNKVMIGLLHYTYFGTTMSFVNYQEPSSYGFLTLI